MSAISRILIKKIDKIGLTLTMFVEYQKFKTASPGLFNGFPIHSEAWVTAVFHQVGYEHREKMIQSLLPC